MSTFLSIDEVVALLGVHKTNVHRNRKAGKYTFREVKSKGGKGGVAYEIALESLPEHAIELYKKQQADKALKTLEDTYPVIKQNLITQPVLNELIKPSEIIKEDLNQYTSKQRDIDLAVKTIIRWIDNYQGKPKDAVMALNKAYRDSINSHHRPCYIKP